MNIEGLADKLTPTPESGGVHKIEHAMQHNHPLGDNRFRRQIEQQYGIEFGRSCRGRPRKRDD